MPDTGISILKELGFGADYEVARRIAHAVSDLGGTGEHFLRLRSEEGLAEKIADLLVLATADDPFAFPVEGPPHDELARLLRTPGIELTDEFRKHDWPDAAPFVVSPGWHRARLVTVRSGSIESKQLREETVRHKLRPAVLEELIFCYIEHPWMFDRKPVGVLGTVGTLPGSKGGSRAIPIMKGSSLHVGSADMVKPDIDYLAIKHQ
ncbi:MAG TPA: hypothetical protein VIF43_02235 [Patescibacteria group bacterium]|jgi:hypothetical protein